MLVVDAEGGKIGGRGAYKTPRVKTISSNAFCRFGRCKELMTGMGIVKTAKSVATLTPAITYQTVWLSRQKPSISLFQKAATGTHIRGRRKHSTMNQQMRKTRPNRMILRRAVLEKMRRYWRRMDIFVKQIATL